MFEEVYIIYKNKKSSHLVKRMTTQIIAYNYLNVNVIIQKIDMSIKAPDDSKM
jgi:hypothetical protein